MAPQKPKQGASAGGSKKRAGKEATGTASSAAAATEQPEEDPLVAVILADSYDSHYAPLTTSTPRCLLPLANVPLINYSFESAARSGVAHIYVLSRAHTPLVRAHIGGSSRGGDGHTGDGDDLSPQAALQAQGIGITVIGTPEALSEGDALRELDAKQILRSDFILYRCDSVCTIDLWPVVQQHRERRKTDKDAIMTMCCLPAGAGPSSEAVQPVHYIDPQTHQVLHYEMTSRRGPASQANEGESSKLVMPLELLRLDEKSGHDEIDVRADLVEAGVDICSIDVPPLFSENFDYQSFSTDFVPGILTSDLLESKIFLHVGENGYGGRAQDTQTYDEIARDILRRRTSPLTPGTSTWLGELLISQQQHPPARRFIAPRVRCHATSSIGSQTMVAAGTTLDANAMITGSILGSGVVVGKASKVVDSHIHAHVRIGQGVSITGSIVGREAAILDNVTLGAGCLLGAGCVVGPSVTLEPGTRVGLRSKESWDDEEEEKDEQDASPAAISASITEILGTEARGYVWPNVWSMHSRQDDGTGEESDMDENEGEEDPAVLRLRSIGFSAHRAADAALSSAHSDTESVSSLAEDSDLDDDGDISDGDETGVSSSAFSQVPGLGGAGAGGGITDLTLGGGTDTRLEQEATSARLAEFDAEAQASMARALVEGYSSDNAVLELKTLRMASNVAPREVQRIAVETLLVECKPADARQVQTTVQRWQRLLTAVAAEDEPETLTAMQAYCAKHASHTALFVPLLKLFYNDDIVSDEAIVAWWRSKAAQNGGDAMLDLRRRAQGVVRYILESGDDDDEDSDDEDDE